MYTVCSAVPLNVVQSRSCSYAQFIATRMSIHDSKQHHALKALSHGAIFLATCNAILLLSKGGSSRYSDRCISRKCDVTMGTVGATERRRREHPGESGGSLTQKNFEI